MEPKKHNKVIETAAEVVKTVLVLAIYMAVVAAIIVILFWAILNLMTLLV